MLSINTNLSSIIVQNSMRESTNALNQAIERMSTGFKINHAKDNAANYSIIDDLNKRISSMIQVQNNTEDGISLLSTAEGGLTQIRDLLSRLRDITVQAANGTYDEKSLESLQTEADAILEEINRIKSNIEFDGRNLYETSVNGQTPANTAVANLAQAVRINNPDTGAIISNNTFALNPVSLMNVGDDLSSSPTSFSLGVNEGNLSNEVNDLDGENGVNTITSPQPSPQGEGVNVNTPEGEGVVATSTQAPMARTMMRSAAPAATILDGAVDIAASATQIVIIDGVEYTVKNNLSSVNSLSWSKDTSTGEVTLLGSSFTITSQKNVSHNLIIRGSSNTVYGGDLADTIKITEASSIHNYIFGGAGDDTITTTVLLPGLYIYGEDGADTIEINGMNGGNIYGGNGNDKFYLKGYASNNLVVNGDAGDDYFEVNWSNAVVNGGEGEDKFNVTSSSSNAKINGGEGTNSIVDNGTNTIKTNVPGATAYSVLFANYETKTININGINYEVTNNKSTAVDFIYSITDSGQIKFTSGSFTIKGEADKQHNVSIYADDIYFYGGNLADTISVDKIVSYIYAEGGNDIINLNAGYGSVYGGAGDDTINIGATIVGERIYLEEGNDTINTNNYKISNSLLSLGEGDDNIVGNSTYSSVGIDGGEGSNTINESSTFTNTLISGFNSNIDNAQTININKSSTINLDIDGVNYQITERGKGDTVLLYAKNQVSNMVTFAGAYLTIQAQTDVSHNITFYGSQLLFYGGNLDDIINVYSYASKCYGRGGDDSMTTYSGDSNLYGENGNDILIANSGSGLYGGFGDDSLIINTTTSSYVANGQDGNDTYQLNAKYTLQDTGGNNTYYINTNGATITGAKDNDTFYVTGNNNIINGVAGDDYFEVTGTGNELHGGTGTSNFVIDAVDNTISANEVSNVIISVPESECTIQTPDKITVIPVPKIQFTDGDVVERVINGQNYKFTNNSGSSSNEISYTINENTGLVTFIGDSVQIECLDNTNYNISLRGSNNIVNGGNQADRITVESGSGNTINGLGGADTLVNQAENNTINGGAENDIITLTKKATAVNGGDGNDTINVNSDNNGAIDTGNGDDTVNVTGSNNTDIITNDGNNTINISGASNEVVSGDGNNKYIITGSNNTLTGGNGLNSVGVSGNENTLTVENANGALNVYGTDNNVTVGIDAATFALNRAATGVINSVNINGSGNTVNQYISESVVTIKGDANTYNSNVGQQNVGVNGDGNSINTTDGNDVFNIKGNSNTITTTGGDNELELKGNSNQVVTGNGEDKVKLTGSYNTILAGDGNDEFTLVSGDNNTIDGEGGDRNTMINFANTTNSSNVYDVTPRPFELSLKVGIGYDFSSVINTSISFNPIFLEVDLSNQESILDSLVSIDECIKSVDEELLKIGSVINRLESVLEEQNIKLDNMISSRSTLRDADIAEVSSHYIQQQILQQASATLMATANQSPSIALQLI